MNQRLQYILPLIAALAACDSPQITEYEPRTGIITGTILYQRPEGPGPCGSDLQGDVVVTLFRSDALPPPQGTSSPVNFIVVAEEVLFNGEPDNGVYTAPFTMPTVPEGRYQIRAFVDADEDFHPTIDLLGQTTGGDVGGGHVDAETGQFLEVEVKNDEITAQVTVSIGRVIPVERPVFVHSSTTTFTVPYATPQTLVLNSHSLSRGRISTDPACSTFLVSYADLDADGVPDDANGDHLPDMFPQVILRLEKTEAQTRDIIIPAIIDPLPYRDTLAVVPAVPTSTVALLLPPVAVDLSDGGRQILTDIPPGRYETIVISGMGQTWQVPNQIDAIALEGEPDPSQGVWVTMQAGPARPPGGIQGKVRVVPEAQGDVFVVAFDAANPPPPAGTGGPVGLATVPAAAFDGISAGRAADFTISGLPPGQYLLSGLLDVDGSFSPLSSLLAQPSAGDYSGLAAAPIVVQQGLSTGADLRIDTLVPFDRPAFEIPQGLSFSRADFPATMSLVAHAVPALGIDEASAMLPIMLSEGDQEGDNFQDLLPRVLLTKMVDVGDPRSAPNDPRGIVIPALVNPLPYYAPLIGGVNAVPTGAYEVILPPTAVELAAGGAQISPPPPGRYRVNVLSGTGQTWSVPNDLDLALARVGGPLEDPSQAQFVTVQDTALPQGSIEGLVQLALQPAAEDFSVVVFAFAADNPPPPLGGGEPVAVTVLRKADFGAGDSAPYRLGPLATGAYTVRAFLDDNDNFTPWFGTMNQPDLGDVGGGYVDGTGAFQVVTVDAQQGASLDVPVIISRLATYPVNRPAFSVTGPGPVLMPATGSVAVALTALSELNDVASVQGVFPIQWIDVTADGRADDVNGDGNPDVYPLIVADLLDPEDESNMRVSGRGVRIPGLIDPRQFIGLGFPAMDVTATATVVPTNSLQVIFPALATSQEQGGAVITPPAGRYRITLVNGAGQTWALPNELQMAEGTALIETQGQFLTVPE